MNYLPVNVYTSGGYDCTAGGVTHRMPERLVVPCEDGHITLEDVANRGYVVLELKTMNVGGRESVSFKPEGIRGHSMFGGNFVYTSDSRFAKKYGRQPIHVHDRVER